MHLRRGSGSGERRNSPSIVLEGGGVLRGIKEVIRLGLEGPVTGTGWSMRAKDTVKGDTKKGNVIENSTYAVLGLGEREEVVSRQDGTISLQSLYKGHYCKGKCRPVRGLVRGIYK